MNIHEIPRDYKGESRILYIFSTKALIYSAIGFGVGSFFWLILKLIGLSMVGLVIALIFGVIGFCIGTFKMPDTKRFKLTEKTGGEAIDDVIKRWIKFKMQKNKIYVYMKGDTKDE